MASLKKPKSCECGSINFFRLFYPERWVCSSCSKVVVTRGNKNDPNKCRVCGIDRTAIKFKPGGNICVNCLSEYHRKYRETKKDSIKERKRILYLLNKKKYKESVRNAIQRSPEAFIRNLHHHIVKRSNRLNKSNRVDVNISYEHLLSIYHSQQGKCALSGLPMSHQFKDPRSISVDRIDSTNGYVVGNVQLVCKAFNLMKNNMTQDETKRILDDYFELRFKNMAKS